MYFGIVFQKARLLVARTVYFWHCKCNRGASSLRDGEKIELGMDWRLGMARHKQSKLEPVQESFRFNYQH